MMEQKVARFCLWRGVSSLCSIACGHPLLVFMRRGVKPDVRVTLPRRLPSNFSYIKVTLLWAGFTAP